MVPEKRGSHYGLLEAWGRVRPWRGQGSTPPWAPLPDLAIPGVDGLKPCGLGPCPRGSGDDVLPSLHPFRGRGIGTRQSRENRSQPVLGAGGPPDCTRTRGLPADLGALDLGLCGGGKVCQGDPAPNVSAQSYPLLSHVHLLSVFDWGRLWTRRGWAAGFSFACQCRRVCRLGIYL